MKNIRIFCLKIFSFSLRKHAYSNILKIFPPINENFQIKILIFLIFFAQNIDCGYSLEPPRRGGSNEYPQYMFLSRNKNKSTACGCQRSAVVSLFIMNN